MDKKGNPILNVITDSSRGGHDICSNVKADLYAVESFAKVSRGDLVEISVERPMLGLRGAKVKAILGKAR